MVDGRIGSDWNGGMRGCDWLCIGRRQSFVFRWWCVIGGLLGPLQGLAEGREGREGGGGGGG